MKKATLICFLLLAAACGQDANCNAATVAPVFEPTRQPFFAFQNGFKGSSPAQMATTLQELGYDGLSGEGYAVLPFIKELQARNLKLYNTYLTLEFDAATNALTEPLRKLVAELQGSGAALWIAITKVTRDGKAFPNSSPEGDAIAMARLGEIANYAEPRGVKIAIYPHTGFRVERVGDAVQIGRAHV